MAEPRALPAHRSFVSVELPFLVTPYAQPAAIAGATATVADVQRTAVESFLPPSLLAPCLTVAQVPNPLRGSLGDLPENEHKEQQPGEQQEQQTTLDISDPLKYEPQPIFSTWRPAAVPPANQSGSDDGTANAPNHDSNLERDEGSAAQRQAQLRAEVFPSLVPQLLIHGYYRNDLVIRVTKRRRIRRRRDLVSGVVVELEELAAQEEETSVDPVSATVVGVVARDLQIARPADFCFSLFSTKQQCEAPHLCGPDVFPPMHFLCKRALTHVQYHMGAEPNTSVKRLGEVGDHSTEYVQHDDLDGGSGGGAGVSTLQSLTITPEEPVLPPQQTAQHAAYLRRLGCSEEVVAAIARGERVGCGGDTANDIVGSSSSNGIDGVPAEVRVVSGLLAQRPVWLTSALAKAIVESGLCPRLFTNKQVVLAMTYAVGTGPFNRLRIRMGYDPYASAQASAVYQRIAVRLNRRGEVGLHVRDLSRSPHIHAALAALRAKHAAVLVRAHQQPRTLHMRDDNSDSKETKEITVRSTSTLLELMCHTVLAGKLYAPLQLADVLDDEVYRTIVESVAPATAMPASQRSRPEGWLSPAALRRAQSHFGDALAAFMRDEVVPAVRALSRGQRVCDANMAPPDPTAAAAASVLAAASAKGDDRSDHDSGSGSSAASSLLVESGPSTSASGSEDGGDSAASDADGEEEEDVESE